MINSSTTWMAEAQQWLAAPCTYTTAKCLSSHVQALRVGRHKKKDFSFFFLLYFNEGISPSVFGSFLMNECSAP